MGVIGGLFLLGGIGACIMGVVTIAIGLWQVDLRMIMEGVVVLISGLISGAIGTAILE